jgi:hypothetical protein
MRISLFGGPGSSKSTVAARLFHDAKVAGHNVELVGEYIKKWAYINKKAQSFDQVYVFGKQIHKEDRLFQAGVKHIITDSPVLMQCAYAKKYKFECWAELLKIAKEFDVTYPSFNIFLDRGNIPYAARQGRYENAEEAAEMDKFILGFLGEHLGKYLVWDASDAKGLSDVVLSALQNAENEV